MATALARVILRKHSRSCFSSVTTKSHPLFTKPKTHQSAVQLLTPYTSRMRCKFFSSDSDPPMKSCSDDSDGPITGGMEKYIPGLDHRHWLVFVDETNFIMPDGKAVEKSEIIDCYIKILAKVFSSEEEAKKKIYSVKCDEWYAFGCEVDMETAYKLGDFDGVLSVIPDSYVDTKYKDYGGELFVNGQIVKRSPERQKRVEVCPEELRA